MYHKDHKKIKTGICISLTEQEKPVTISIVFFSNYTGYDRMFFMTADWLSSELKESRLLINLHITCE